MNEKEYHSARQHVDHFLRAAPDGGFEVWVKRCLIIIAVLACLALWMLIMWRAGGGGRRASDALLSRTIEGIRRNFQCRDFTFQLNVVRKYPDNQQYSQKFRVEGVVGAAESDIFAESTSDDTGDRRRYRVLVRGGEVIRANMESSDGHVEEMERGDEGLNRIVLGDLSYPEFHQIFVLKSEDVDNISEEHGSYVLRSRRMSDSGNSTDPQIANRFVYHIDKGTYLPVTVEFFYEQEKIKEFHVDSKEMVDGRWTIRRGRLEDLRDQSEAIFESDNIRFNQNLDKKMFPGLNSGGNPFIELCERHELCSAASPSWLSH